MFVASIYKGLEYEPLHRGEGPFAAAKTYFATAKCGSLRQSELRCCGPEGVILACQRRSGLRCGGPEGMDTVFLPSTFKIYHVIKINYG